MWSTQGRNGRRRGRPVASTIAVLAGLLTMTSGIGAGSVQAASTSTAPDFGPNVKILDPSMSTSAIQTIVDGIANQQISSQFGAQRYALIFKPGTYGSAAAPLNFQVGYYTEVAGL
jgi:hypothetical protein